MVAGSDYAQLEIGRVVSRTFGAIGGNFVTFLILGLLFGGLPALALGYFMQMVVLPQIYAGGIDVSSVYGTALLIGFGSTLVMMIPAYMLIGAVTHGSVIHLNGGKASLGDCLGTGFGRALPLIALGIVSMLGIALGLILFVIPGLLLATRWAVAAPALVVEKPGIMGALGRAAELSSGNRWRIFWLFVMWFLVAVAIQFFAQLVSGQIITMAYSLGDTALWLYFGLDALVNMITSLIATCGAATLYVELRTIKEGATSEQLAAVFE